MAESFVLSACMVGANFLVSNQALNSDLARQGQQKVQQASSSGSLKTLGAGAVGGGLVGLLMGSKKTKKLGKKVGKNVDKF